MLVNFQIHVNHEWCTDDLRPDWSKDQLVKHEEELRSLVGNLYSRMLGGKIARRIPEVLRSVPLDPEILLRAPNTNGLDSPDEKFASLNELKDGLATLEARVTQALDALEVGEALQMVVDVLKSVCDIRGFASMCSILKYGIIVHRRIDFSLPTHLGCLRLR